DPGAVDRLMPLVYAELRALAASRLSGERMAHTLQPTALVHEAYLRLVGQHSAMESKGHFMALAAEAIRRILVDHVRARKAAKRGGGEGQRVALDESVRVSEDPEVDVEALDGALDELKSLDERVARVVELRFFAGLSEPEVAALLGVSERTVRNDW